MDKRYINTVNAEDTTHPLEQFKFCPKCGDSEFNPNNEKSKRCCNCGFVYYFNSAAAVACFIRNDRDEVLVSRRAVEPSKGMLDLPGGFVDMYESAEQAACREVLEETGLALDDPRFICTLSNRYPYSGFTVHTLDLFFEFRVRSFCGYRPMDDVAELIPIPIAELDPKLFAFESIRNAIEIYRQK